MKSGQLKKALLEVQRLRVEPIYDLAQKLTDAGLSEGDVHLLLRELKTLSDPLKIDLVNAMRDIKTGYAQQICGGKND